MQIIPEDRRERFHRAGEVDFGTGSPAWGGSGVNVFRQRGSISLVMRRLRFGGPTFDELHLPDVVRLAGEPRGLVLVTGPTRAGEDHYPRRDDRAHQPDQTRAHRDDRGSHRGVVQGRPVLDQSARGRQRLTISSRCCNRRGLTRVSVARPDVRRPWRRRYRSWSLSAPSRTGRTDRSNPSARPARPPGCTSRSRLGPTRWPGSPS
jgi:hypothetical protein